MATQAPTAAEAQILLALDEGCDTFYEEDAADLRNLQRRGLVRCQGTRWSLTVAGCDEACRLADDACPGCGCQPGDGLTEGCHHEHGCGYYRAMA